MVEVDPILTALLAAATLIAKDTASEAIKDAYSLVYRRTLERGHFHIVSEEQVLCKVEERHDIASGN